MEALVSALVKDDVLTSIDTYKYDVAAAAIAAGASIVNDVSGLRDERLAALCASTGAALVIMHTAVEPKGTLLDPATYSDVAAEVAEFLRARIDVALAAGVSEEQLILDPGPDFAKTPAQTVAVLRRMDLLRAFGRPILLGRLAQGLRGRDHGAPAGGARSGDAGRARLGRRRGRVDPARARRGGRVRLLRGAVGAARASGCSASSKD